MGTPAPGGITLASSSVEPTTIGEDGDNGTGDLVFDLEFAPGQDTITVTGDFDFTDPDAQADQFFVMPNGILELGVPTSLGTFSIDQSSGEFAFSVTRDDVADAGGSAVRVAQVANSVPAVEAPPRIGDQDQITFNVTVCFGRGALIATPDGERRVEELGEGDLVLTADGRAVPVLWMGVNAVSPMFRPADRLEPVLIRAGALAPVLGSFLPRRDLVVTADHGMVLDTANGPMVVNASALVGAPGIEFLDWRRLGGDFAYYHIETEGHEVVLAEGAPSETYIDYVGRRSFSNYADYEARFGTERIIAEMDAPRLSSPRLLPDDLCAALGIEDDRSAEVVLDKAFDRAA